MTKIVFLRHGLSTWNVENRFTGWTDVDLAPAGVDEAREAGRLLNHYDFEFDVMFTSVLKRAIRTLWLVQDTMDCMWLPVVKDWRLNERHYGALQGLNKAETAQQYGGAQVHEWRRSYAVQPPPLPETDPRLPGRDRRYADIDFARLPRTESLADTMVRVSACWQDSILPRVRSGQRLLLVAHGNSIRALVKLLEDLDDEEIMRVEIPTGIPLVYEFDRDLKVTAHSYLGRPAQTAAG